MRVIYSWTDVLDEGEVVRPVHDKGRLFILMDERAPKDLLARRLSVTLTRLVEREWLHVGTVSDVA